MNPRIILLGAAAVFVAVAAAFLARSYLQSNAPDQAQTTNQQETTRILVAANNLPMGHVVEVGDLSWQDWPLEGLNANYLQEESYNLEDMAGNSIGRPFEVDVFDKVDRTLQAQTVSLPFTVTAR